MLRLGSERGAAGEIVGRTVYVIGLASNAMEPRPDRKPRSGASVHVGEPLLEEEDDVLMARAGAGDREACRRLVERHLPRMVAFASRVMGNRADGEEVAQEVFLRLWARAERWQAGQARLSTWLHRVALNLCLDRLARRREQALDEGPEAIDPTPAPAQVLEEKEIGRYVNLELGKLPPRQRIAMTLCYYQGLGNREAASIIDVSVEALESLLARARRTLRQRLEALAARLLE